MKKKSSLLIILAFHYPLSPVIFTGLSETGVKKNNFACPSSSSSSISCVSNTNITSIMHDDTIIQIFNDQAFWLHEKATSAQYQQTTLNYSTTELSEKLSEQGWGSTGGYCILITSNPLLGSFIQPKLQPNKNQKKIIAQLWYNGNSSLELWSQDVQLLNSDQTFQVAVTNQPDALNSLNETNQTKTLKNEFLQSLNLQPNNRDQATYDAATDSPRSIKIQS